MVDDAILKNATETAWNGVPGKAPRGRRSRQPSLPLGAPSAQDLGRVRERHRRTRELRHRLPASASSRRMLTCMKMIVARVAVGSTRPGWTLLAISFLISAVLVVGLRTALGA